MLSVWDGTKRWIVTSNMLFFVLVYLLLAYTTFSGRTAEGYTGIFLDKSATPHFHVIYVVWTDLRTARFFFYFLLIPYKQHIPRILSSFHYQNAKWWHFPWRNVCHCLLCLANDVVIYCMGFSLAFKLCFVTTERVCVCAFFAQPKLCDI